MQALLNQLAKTIETYAIGEGLQPSPIAGVQCIKVSRTGVRKKNRWHASLCIVVQGCKEIILGQKIYRCSEAHYTAAPLDLPVTSRTLAKPNEPFLCLKIDFDALMLSEVASQIKTGVLNDTENALPAFFIGKANEPMLETALRLAKLFQTPDDAKVLGPLLVKEMMYHLLKGPDGPALLQFLHSGSKTHQIAQALHQLKSELDQEVDVTALAKTSHMSRSAFFKHFKEITAMSPIQYQKRLRLLEARRLMTEEGETAEGSAFKVGYNSASQFSREFSRMFGSSPGRSLNGHR